MSQTFDYETKYQIGSREIEIIVSYTYSSGRPATREEPEDPPEIDFTGIIYRQTGQFEWKTLGASELLHTLILEDDGLYQSILDNHNDGPDPDLEAEDIREAERLAKEHWNDV